MHGRRNKGQQCRKMDDTLKDDSPMPWGQHKGTIMEDIPAAYLLWCYDNDKCCPRVRAYVEDNRDVLELELKRKQG